MGTLNGGVKELDTTSRQSSVGRLELPQSVQVDLEELVEKLLTGFVKLVIIIFCTAVSSCFVFPNQILLIAALSLAWGHS